MSFKADKVSLLMIRVQKKWSEKQPRPIFYNQHSQQRRRKFLGPIYSLKRRSITSTNSSIKKPPFGIPSPLAAICPPDLHNFFPFNRLRLSLITQHTSLSSSSESIFSRPMRQHRCSILSKLLYYYPNKGYHMNLAASVISYKWLDVLTRECFF